MGKTFEKKLPYKKAICYSGYREGQCPTGEMPSKEQISEDLHLLVADGYGYIRMYEPNAHAVTALQVIREEKLPLQCMIGIDHYRKSEEIVGFVFEAFDELWKDPSSPAASECNWGIYDINRKKKW